MKKKSQLLIEKRFLSILRNNGVEWISELMRDGGVDEGEQFVLLFALVVEDRARDVD